MTTFFLVRSVRIERNCFVFSSFACEREEEGVGGGEGADHCEEGPHEGEGAQRERSCFAFSSLWPSRSVGSEKPGRASAGGGAPPRSGKPPGLGSPPAWTEAARGARGGGQLRRRQDGGHSVLTVLRSRLQLRPRVVDGVRQLLDARLHSAGCREGVNHCGGMST